ncbi:hypothetical protein PG993_014736 [Apiospora rasikravindrae]|uniref:Uncharacterized protein n=1 Tax=Apiospora rasikravindrae TaxID=990691 RepID=A0ABR1RNT6_9PEZI
MAETYDLFAAPLVVRRLVYSHVFANGNGNNLCAAAPILQEEALPETMCKEEPLLCLTVYIKAYDQKTRNDWLKMEWKTRHNEVFTHVFTTLKHRIVRRLKSSVRKIEQLNVIIDPPAANDSDGSQILYLWAKVREVAFLLSNIWYWDVDHLMIKMSSEGSQTFNLCSKRLGDLPLNIQCEYNFLSLVHMAVLEPLFSARKMGNTSLSWYCQAHPDRKTTPEPMLDLVDLLAAPVGTGFPLLRTYNTEKFTNINGYWHELTLNRMRVEVFKITFVFDAALDYFRGNAANHLRLQRFRTWEMGEQSVLSHESWKQMVKSLKYNRQQLQFLKNLRKASLMHFDPAAFKRSVEAIHDKEWIDVVIRRNDAMLPYLLPTNPPLPPAAGGKSQAFVAQWTRDQMDGITESYPVDEWSKRYPLGIPKISDILKHQDGEDVENHDENANEVKDGNEDKSEEDEGEVFASFSEAFPDEINDLEERLNEADPDGDNDFDGWYNLWH